MLVSLLLKQNAFKDNSSWALSLLEYNICIKILVSSMQSNSEELILTNRSQNCNHMNSFIIDSSSMVIITQKTRFTKIYSSKSSSTVSSGISSFPSKELPFWEDWMKLKLLSRSQRFVFKLSLSSAKVKEKLTNRQSIWVSTSGEYPQLRSKLVYICRIVYF